MIVRIPLDETNSRVSYQYTPLVITPSFTPDAEQSKVPVTSAMPVEFSQLSYSLSPVTLPAYTSSRYAYPVRELSVTVPEADRPVVASWFGNAGAGAGAPSDTLKKRMTTAVITAIKDFFNDSSRAGLFTRPFLLGYALLTTDGKLLAPQYAGVITPNSQAPVMAIRSANPIGEQLVTLTEIRNLSCRLSVSLPAFTLPTELVSLVSKVVFYVTDQVMPLTGDEEVTGVRTFRIDNANCPGWYYSRLSETLVRDRALADSTFRIIGSVPISKALAGITDYRLPDAQLDLTDFKNYPKAEDVPDVENPDPGTDPDNPPVVDPDDPEYPYDPGVRPGQTPSRLIVRTAALDLDMPEVDKRVQAVTARGIFCRHPDNVTITLYGAHHIPGDEIDGTLAIGTGVVADAGRWRKIAKARGPHIRLLRGVRYRYLRVDITAPYPSRLDALTFLLPTTPSR